MRDVHIKYLSMVLERGDGMEEGDRVARSS